MAKISEVCPICNGKGFIIMPTTFADDERADGPISCPDCKGEGYVDAMRPIPRKKK